MNNFNILIIHKLMMDKLIVYIYVQCMYIYLLLYTMSLIIIDVLYFKWQSTDKTTIIAIAICNHIVYYKK